MKNISKTFCILPWMHLATNSSGNLRVCCNSTPGENFILKDNGQPYKIYKDSISEAWNSTVYKTIRKQMMNGERPQMCSRCFREEDAGVKSARQSWNENWMFDYDKSETPPLNVKYIDLRLGNLCNLKCRMCNPYASNQWVKEWNEFNDALSESEQERLLNLNWHEHQDLILKLKDVLENVEEIYLTGGEPTLSKGNKRLLEYLVHYHPSQSITIKYNTNLTNCQESFYNNWKYFKEIKLNCSIDGYGKINDYIRYPSKWDAVISNLDFFMSDYFDNVKIQIHTTISMDNILTIHQLFDFLLERYNIFPYLNILNHPHYLNIQCLNPEMKNTVKQNLSKYLTYPKVDGIIKYMFENQFNDEEYYQKTMKLNSIRYGEE